MLYAEFPALCEAVYVSLVVENPSTGTKCIVDVKVDTGSPYTILPKQVMDSIGLTPFTSETLETVSGELFETSISMGRIHLDDSGDYVDLPIHIANEELSMPLLGMDIIRKGDVTLKHIIDDNQQQWLLFTFDLLAEEDRLML
ncbi:MAG: retroviral-like aspartic protease family protein [Paludibacteraceae bacterium]|nr:retroviral-like aspartic protease family protein [Paludibacteraceae bacterium]